MELNVSILPFDEPSVKMWNHCSMYMMALTGLWITIYWFFHRQFTFWSRKGVTFYKPHLVFGSMERIVRGKTSAAELACEVYNSYEGEPFVGVWEFFRPRLFVRDLELVRRILVKDSDNWMNRGLYVNERLDPLSGHLINLSGKKWKVVRSKLTPTFTSIRMKEMFHLLSLCGNELEKCLQTAAESNKLIEARDFSARFTIDVIGSCVFGIDINGLHDENNEFIKISEKMFIMSRIRRIRRVIQTMFPAIFKILRMRIHSQEITDFFMKLVGDTMDYREKNGIRKHDFIDILRELKDTSVGEDDADGVVFDVKLLTAQAFIFFGAGFETSSTAISFCMHELAVHQEIQQRLRNEVHEIKAKNDGEITFDSLNDLKYMDMIIKETLRKYTPFTLTARECSEEYTIPGTNIVLPSGMKAVIPIYAIHHDPKYFPEPEKFDPERFSNDAKNQRHPFAYIPFGGGPRICIGQRFAEMQTKLGLAKLVDKFQVSLCEKSQNPLKLKRGTNFLAPERGIWLRVSAV